MGIPVVFGHLHSLKLRLENADIALSEMGISMSAALTMFLTKVSKDKCMPFDINIPDDPFFSPENIARLERSAAQIERTGGTIHEIGEIGNV